MFFMLVKIKHIYMYNNGAPKTGVLKNDLITF